MLILDEISRDTGGFYGVVLDRVGASHGFMKLCCCGTFEGSLGLTRLQTLQAALLMKQMGRGC